MVQHVNGQQLEELVQTSDKPVVCDFWANWCGPCRMLGPIFEEVASEYADKATFVKVDVDEDSSAEAAKKYGISSIPNVLVFKNGQVAANNLGFVPKAVSAASIEKNV